MSERTASPVTVVVILNDGSHTALITFQSHSVPAEGERFSLSTCDEAHPEKEQRVSYRVHRRTWCHRTRKAGRKVIQELMVELYVWPESTTP